MRIMRLYGKRAERPNWTLPFFAGLAAGIFCVYLNTDSFLAENGLLSRMSLERLGRLDLNENAFFFYVFGKRLGFVWLAAILATTFAGIVTTYLLVLWIGACGGVIAAVAVMRYGIKGFLLLAGGMMPQFLLYFPAFIMLADWCIKTCLRLYYPIVDYTEQQPEKSKKTETIGRFLFIHGVVIIGVILESYVNPEILLFVLKTL